MGWLGNVLRPLREKFPYWEFFWSEFPRIRTECGVPLRVLSECVKMRTRKTSNTDTFHGPLETLEPCQTSTRDFSCKSSWQLKTVKYFHKKDPSQMFDWVLNTSLALHKIQYKTELESAYFITLFAIFLQSYNSILFCAFLKN